MKLKKGAWDGAQPRTHVLQVLKKHGIRVEIGDDDGDNYTLTDIEGDPVVVPIPNPVPSEVVVFLFRRFGALHGFAITDLVKNPALH